MAHITFNIPGDKQDLLKECRDYYVKDPIVLKQVPEELKRAKASLRDEGPEFIIDAFPVYYSVLHHSQGLQMDIIFIAYENLHKAVQDLNKAVGFLLEDTDSLTDEVKAKFLTVLKMLIYIYTKVVLLIEEKNSAATNLSLIKYRKKSQESPHDLNKQNILALLNSILQQDVKVLWSPPVIDEDFLKLIFEVAYAFLQNPKLKSEKEEQNELFDLFGTLITNYHHGTSFVIRVVQLIKISEHLVNCLPEGIERLVKKFNCKGIVHGLVKEITECQTDEKYQDGQNARQSGAILTELAVLIPDLMMPEVLYLSKYLSYDSPVLRNSVLNVYTEIILKVLTVHDLADEQKEYRDEILTALSDHILDITAIVRSKVIQNWTRLQQENGIPLKWQNNIMEKILPHLKDKGALVRKSAVHFFTSCLSHNLFSSTLSLKEKTEELEQKKNLLKVVMVPYENIKKSKLEEIEKQWLQIESDIHTVLTEEMSKEVENGEDDAELSDDEKTPDMIRLYLNGAMYKEAVILFRSVFKNMDEWQELMENYNKENEEAMCIAALKNLFINAENVSEEVERGLINGEGLMSHEDFKKMETLIKECEYLESCVKYLQLIDAAIKPIGELLETTAIGDMHGAVEFFVTAYQFNIDNANTGILEMLKIMQRPEQDRKDCIVESFKTIFLVTHTKNLTEHTITIVNRLIQLLKTVPTGNLDDLELIISQWTSKGTLDNAVIDMLWQYFTKKVPVSDEESRWATELLRMASSGRKTIISKNIKLVSTLAFGERGRSSMEFLGAATKLLSVIGNERIDMNAKNPPMKIKGHDPMFVDLLDILTEKFLEPVPFYSKALVGGVNFIYKMCNTPEKCIEKLLMNIMEKIQKEQTEKTGIENFGCVRLCQLLGLIARKQLEYLDDSVYKEMKRRQNILEERQEAKKGVKNNSKRKKNNNRSHATANDSTLNVTENEDSVLQGAQADDTDAEFILNILENHIVTGSGGLAKFTPFIINICERLNTFDKVLQEAAVVALLGYMLVSSKFCKQHIQLLFTIFEKTTHSEIQCSILVNLSDLLTRFPNIVEPWTPRICNRLKDPLNDIRKAAFFTISNLILHDMIRSHQYISLMVSCLVCEDEEMISMCRTFFVQLSNKENNLYNVLPDIFSHLLLDESLSEENIREIMKYLFTLIDNSKRMESLVDRFCIKYPLTQDVVQHRAITYCLTMIQYNDKSLRKLQENFHNYKHLLQDTEIYNDFKTILSTCNKSQVGKVDLKPIVAEMEKSIASVFELNDNGEQLMRPPPPPKALKKGRQVVKKKAADKRKWNSDEEVNINDASVTSTPVRRSTRKKSKSKQENSSDSDSD